MIFDPAGGCAWKCRNKSHKKLCIDILSHLTGKANLIKQHEYTDTAVLRKRIKLTIIKEIK
jgi:hypothetical protein